MERVGLCATCEHVRAVESGRGSRFHLCTAAKDDPRLPKYPPLPRLTCVGFRQRASKLEGRGPDE